MTIALCVVWFLSYSLMALLRVNLKHYVVLEYTNSHNPQGQVISLSVYSTHLTEHSHIMHSMNTQPLKHIINGDKRNNEGYSVFKLHLPWGLIEILLYGGSENAQLFHWSCRATIAMTFSPNAASTVCELLLLTSLPY